MIMMKEIDDCEHCIRVRDLCPYHYRRVILESWVKYGSSKVDLGEDVRKVITAFVETFDIVPAMYRERFGGGK